MSIFQKNWREQFWNIMTHSGLANTKGRNEMCEIGLILEKTNNWKATVIQIKLDLS